MAERKTRCPEEMIIKVTEEEDAHRATYAKPRREFMKEFKALLRCTKCLKDCESKIKAGSDVGVHPLLNVFFCEACQGFYGDGEFSMDEGEDKYCRWCGEGGTLFLCSECVHGFCPKCIKRNLGRKILRSAKNDDNWKCFFCNPEPLWLLRYVTAEAVKIAASRERDASSPDDGSKSSSKLGSTKRAISSDSEGSSKGSVPRKRLKISDDDDVPAPDNETVQEPNKSVEEKSSASEGSSKSPDSRKSETVQSDEEEDTQKPEQQAEKTDDAAELPSGVVNGENGEAHSSDEVIKNGPPDPAKNLRKLYHSCGFMGHILAKKLKRRIDALTPDTLAQCRLQVKEMTEKLKPLVLELQHKLDNIDQNNTSD